MGTELPKILVYADLQVTPDDGKSYELVRGKLHVSPSPSPMHQRVSKRLQRQLENYFEGRALGEVFDAPIDLILTDSDVFVPDIVVVTDPDHITRRGIEAPPALVVEVLSPSTRRQDRSVKAQRYAELGISHYWMVDTDRRRIECHELADGRFRPVVEAEGSKTFEHPAWPGLVIDLDALWR